jgi:PPM family protein phosphatase
MAELRVGGSTHKGQIRPENEDNILVTDRLFIVADGMGGHEAGEIASQIAVERISELLDGDDPPSAQEVVDAIRVTNGDIFRAAIANPEQHGMGTTVTVIAVIADAFAGRAAPNIISTGSRANSAPTLARTARATAPSPTRPCPATSPR